MASVQLYMYDLTGGLAAQFSAQLLGRHVEAVWHTSVVVFSREWWYGSGVSDAAPGCSHFGPPHRVLNLGTTRRSRVELEEQVRVWRASTFALGTYALLSHNCNTFSAAVTDFLGTSGVPREVLELPALVLASPLAPMLAPLLEPLSQSINGQQTPARQLAAPTESVLAEEALFEAEVREEFARLIAVGMSAEAAGDAAVEAVLARAGLDA